MAKYEIKVIVFGKEMVDYFSKLGYSISFVNVSNEKSLEKKNEILKYLLSIGFQWAGEGPLDFYRVIAILIYNEGMGKLQYCSENWYNKQEYEKLLIITDETVVCDPFVIGL